MIYFKYIKMVIRSQLQYRMSLWMTMIGQFFVAFFAFIGMFLLFERFGNLKGWSFPEVCLCFAVTGTAFAVTECVASGFALFSGMIVRGEFDRVMIRPRSTLLQVLGANFDLSRIGLLIQSFVVLAIALSMLEHITFAKCVVLLLMVLSGVAVFSGVFILGATVCFFTVQGLEIINLFTYGGREMASYPLNIYNKWMARFFTFVIPFGCFNYLPLLYIVGRAEGHELLYMALPIVGMLFIVPCLLVWNFGVKHYLSTGS